MNHRYLCQQLHIQHKIKYKSTHSKLNINATGVYEKYILTINTVNFTAIIIHM